MMEEKKEMNNKTSNIEPIPIEEAIYDYTQAYKDYKKLIQQANKYIQSDKEVLTAILKHYLPECNIKIIGEQIILTYNGEDRFEFLKQVYDQLELTDCKTTWGLENDTTTVYIDIKGGLNKQ